MSGRIGLSRQRRGRDLSGPLHRSLEAMSALNAEGKPVSQVGWDLATLMRSRGVWVAFLPTGGDGATPWRGMVVYDREYSSEGQAISPARIGLVAHELTHVLQRDQTNEIYWPSGFFRITRFTRWIADSTNFMEVLAYIVGYAVEYDLSVEQLKATGGGSRTLAKRMWAIEHHLATLTGADPRNATRYILKMYPTNWFYKQNYRKESTIEDGRIPAGDWATWLMRCGFQREGVEHIRQVATEGEEEIVDTTVADEIAEIERNYPERQRESTNTFLRLARQEMLRRFDQSLAVTSLWLVSFILLHGWLASLLNGRPGWLQSLYAGGLWLGWFGLGALVVTVTSIDHTLRDSGPRYASPNPDWRGIVLGGLFTAAMLVLLLLTQSSLTIDLSITYTILDLEGYQVVSLPLLAFSMGFFYALLGYISSKIRKYWAEGLSVPVVQTISNIVRGKREEGEVE